MTDLRQAAQQALDALEDLGMRHFENTGEKLYADIYIALRTALKQQAEPVCWCRKCNENRLVNNIPFSMTRMILCPTCGNKRCPKASDHRLGCTDSNAAGQPGSVYPAPPKQQAEPVPEPVATVTVMTQGVRRNYSFQALQKLPDGVNNLYTTPPQRKPLTDEQAKAIAYVGPIYAPDGVVIRSPLDFRKELEQHRMDAIRRTEAAHGIKEGT